ncbi:MAG: hypothetical protein JXR50_06330 [Prolixibacteraceae bacterium]|nr:hypothetical protein [Prolixibacteraceae bacterium]
MEQTFFQNRDEAVIYFAGHALQGLLSNGFGISFPDQVARKAILIGETMADHLGITNNSIQDVEHKND